MKNGTFDQMPLAYKDAFLRVNPDSARLMNMYQKCEERMTQFKDIPDNLISAVKSPVLLINGDKDVATSEHMVTISTLIPDCRLAIIPGGHGEYIGEISTLKPGYKASDFVIGLVENFLNEK